MASPLDDERIQFFLRHRDDIKAWSAIESEVTAAVRELLGALQPEIEERVQAFIRRFLRELSEKIAASLAF